MPTHVDAAGKSTLAVSERLVGEVAEDPVLAEAGGFDAHGPWGKAILFGEVPEGTDTVWSAVPIGIEHNETRLPECDARHGVWERLPELSDCSLISCRPCLPTCNAGLLVITLRRPVEGDPHGEHRQTGSREFECGVED